MVDSNLRLLLVLALVTSFLFLKVLFTSKLRWIDVCPSPAQLHFKVSKSTDLQRVKEHDSGVPIYFE